MLHDGFSHWNLPASWALVHLAFNPEWKEKAIAEIKALFHNHKTWRATDPLQTRLASISQDAWETETPVLEAILKETLRLTMTGAPSRRITSPDIKLGDVVIEKGAFLTYSQGEAHLNPRIYPDPYRFDPDRYRPGRDEDKKEAFCYLAFGAGTLIISFRKIPLISLCFRSSSLCRYEIGKTGDEIDHVIIPSRL